MKKFDDEQKRRKNFYKTLYEENTRFNKEYQKIILRIHKLNLNRQKQI